MSKADRSIRFHFSLKQRDTSSTVWRLCDECWYRIRCSCQLFRPRHVGDMFFPGTVTFDGAFSIMFLPSVPVVFFICYFHFSCDRHLGLYYVSVFDPIVLWIWAFAVFSGWPEINFYYYYYLRQNCAGKPGSKHEIRRWNLGATSKRTLVDPSNGFESANAP